MDDGFDQAGCPIGTATEGETEAGTASNSASETESADGTASASNTASAGSVSADGTSDTLDSTASEGDSEGLCPILNVDLSPRTPTVMLLVDQSGSMAQPFGDTDRWTAIQQALVDPTNGVVPRYDDEVRFGLNLYTGTEMTCPELQGPAPALDNLDPIAQTFTDNAPAADTPTGDAIESVAATLAADTFEGPKLIILATDGEPDTCAIPNPGNEQQANETRAAAVAATEAAFTAGIETRVISVGNEISDAHLQDMANAGQGVGAGQPDAEFYRALDQAQLDAAFAEIINGVRDCLWQLEQPVTQQEGDECRVEINGTEIPFEASDGWRFVSDGEIELLGGSCDSIQEGEVNIQMICGCNIVEGGG